MQGEAGPEAQASKGSIGGVLRGSQARDRLLNLNQRNGFWVSPAGSYLRCWEAGETVEHKGSQGSHVRNFHLPVTLQLLSRVCTHMRDCCQCKAPAGYLAKQNGC